MPSTPQKDGDATETSINSPTRALQLWFGVHRADLLTSSAFGFSVNLALPSRFGHRDLGTQGRHVMPSMRRLLIATLCSALAILTMGSPTVSAAGHGQPGVSPPQSRPYGFTYGAWNAKWWQWLLQTPFSKNPVFMDTAVGKPSAPAAVDCSAGQSGHVWFLGGTYQPTNAPNVPARADVYRTCKIPSGIALLFPLVNTEFDNLGCPNTDYSAKELRAAARLGIDDIVPGSLSASIDGIAVSGLVDGRSKYRSPSPWFSYSLPADNIGTLICGHPFPIGTKPPAVAPHRGGAIADGIYLMLRPLRPGIHTLHFGGEINIPSTPAPAPPQGPTDFIQNINYTITVTSRR